MFFQKPIATRSNMLLVSLHYVFQAVGHKNAFTHTYIALVEHKLAQSKQNTNNIPQIKFRRNNRGTDQRSLLFFKVSEYTFTFPMFQNSLCILFSLMKAQCYYSKLHSIRSRPLRNYMSLTNNPTQCYNYNFTQHLKV